MSGTGQNQETSAVLKRLAARALGLTGADIQRIVKEAKANARRQRRPLALADLEAGIRRHRPQLSPERLRATAVHEAGHLLVHYMLGLGPIKGVTIDDRSGGGYGSLGFDTQHVMRRDWFVDMMTMLLAGRAAETLIFVEAGTGAGGSDDSDLARATVIAFALERTLGLGQKHPLLYRPHARPAVVLDADPVLAARVHGHLERAEELAGRLITENRKGFDILVEALIEAQALDGPDVASILDQAGVTSQGRSAKADVE